MRQALPSPSRTTQNPHNLNRVPRLSTSRRVSLAIQLIGDGLQAGSCFPSLHDDRLEIRIRFVRGLMMVGRVTHHKMLKGVRERNKKMSRRQNKSGRHFSVKAPPEELLERRCPHLAFFEESYYDRVVAKADKSNESYRCKGVNGVDQRKGVSKKRTTWPGQHLRCGICNRNCVWSGTRARRLMKCSGSQLHQCWNGIEVNGELISRKLSESILAEIMALPDFDAEFLNKFRDEWCQHRQILQAQKEEAQAPA